jgi:hypothetical protein
MTWFPIVTGVLGMLNVESLMLPYVLLGHTRRVRRDGYVGFRLHDARYICLVLLMLMFRPTW